MTRFFIRATLIGVASFFLAINSWATAGSRKSEETYKDLITKSQNLVLQKDRQQAINILVTALANEKLGTRYYKELKKALVEISQVFISDKAQQTFELSLSLKKPDLPQAQQKLAEALRIEPDNLTLILESARQSLSRSECKSAEETLEQVQKLIPYVEELQLTLIQTQLCLGKSQAYIKWKDELTNSIDKVTWLSIEIEKSLKDKNYSKTRDLVNQLKKIEKNYPEINYWLWKAENDKNPKKVEAAQIYLSNCRNMTSAQYRQWHLDPWLCRRTAEVESYLSSQPQGR